MVMRDTDEDDATACLRWLRATEGDPNDARPDGGDDDDAPPTNVTRLLVVDDDDSADASADAGARPRSRVGHLPQWAWDNFDADAYRPGYAADVCLSGANLKPYDYVSAVREVDPRLATIEERILIGRESAKDVALSLDMDPSTLSHARQKAEARVTAWRDESPLNREPGIDREIFALWRQGHDVPAIAPQVHMLRHHVDKILHRMIYEYAREMPRCSAHNGAGASQESFNPFLDDERARRPTGPRRPSSYRTGDNVRARILDVIPTLMALKGEPPSRREIQTAIGARSTLDRYLTRMVTDGDLRRGPGGRGYELVAPHRTDQRRTRGCTA